MDHSKIISKVSAALLEMPLGTTGIRFGVVVTRSARGSFEVHMWGVSAGVDSEAAAEQIAASSDFVLGAMNTRDVITLARKHRDEGGMVSSARLCLQTACRLDGEGSLAAARMWALKSLAYSVGVFHDDYKRAAR
jgi:hypothetical protein